MCVGEREEEGGGGGRGRECEYRRKRESATSYLCDSYLNGYTIVMLFYWRL